MQTNHSTICPKCKKENQCALTSSEKIKNDCWCMNPNLKFPKELIDQLSETEKNRSCICLTCAQSFEQKS